MPRTQKIFALACLVGGALSGCGEPTLAFTGALEVIYLPLDGARGLTGAVSPSIYFSAEVDENSVTADAVFLQTTGWSCTGEGASQVCECGASWARVAGMASAQGTVVKFTPSSNLQAKSCFAMICTTSVRGTQRAPLRSLGLPAESKRALGLSTAVDVGALQQFWTAP